jgi:archaeal type IV pilus assembly protein PilA
MKKLFYKKDPSDAVSPVVGVMLMLVVTIIIAAVVSAFAGGLTTGQEKAPTATMDIVVANEGHGYLNGLYFKVTSVSEPIQTKDVKLVTTWKAKDGTVGGATVLPWTPGKAMNVNLTGEWWEQSSYSPCGYGPGINWSMKTMNERPDQYWGNYTLIPGVASQSQSAFDWGGYGARGGSSTSGLPFHYYQYVDEPHTWISGVDRDGAMATLGDNWYHLRPGDTVNVKFIHIPTGKTILDKDVIVGVSL